jgi:cytoskeletal protein CcmA (bactofilin family)
VVFRRDSKVDAFQRQISALRHQLGGEPGDFALQEYDPAPRGDSVYRGEFPDLDAVGFERDLARSPREEIARPGLEETAPSPPAVPAADLNTSVLSHTTTWSGNLESTGSLHIHGRVEGALTAREDIFIAEEADVDATISAANVTIAGNVRGSIQCAERFEILPRGRVGGDVRAPVIVIHEGALFAGEISMSSAQDAKSSLPAAPSPRAARGGD